MLKIGALKFLCLNKIFITDFIVDIFLKPNFFVVILTLLLSSGITFAQSEDENNSGNCTHNGYKLFGKIQFVESFPDITVQVVESFPDLKVKIVNSFPHECGEWQIADSFPDLKVQIVESFPDIKIKFVESFPGLP